MQFHNSFIVNLQIQMVYICCMFGHWIRNRGNQTAALRHSR